MFIKAALLLSILFISDICFGQNSIKESDNALKNRIKGKIKKNVVGNRANGLAVFYFKSDNSVFSVEKREEYKTDKRTDSSSSFSANFQNDTLFRIVIRIHRLSEKPGRVIMYLKGDNIVDQEMVGNVYIPEISSIIEKAYQLLLKAKELIKAR